MNIGAINPNELSGLNISGLGDTVLEGASIATTAKTGDSAILTGPALVVTTAARQAASDALSEALGNPTVTKEAALLSMMDSYFEAAKTTADNMKMSEQEMKLVEAKLEELKQQMQDLEGKKVTLEKAIDNFNNTFLAAEKDMLDRQMMEIKV